MVKSKQSPGQLSIDGTEDDLNKRTETQTEDE